MIIDKYLISVEALAARRGREDLVIVDTREPEDYQLDHIPRAVNIHDIFTYLATWENGGYPAMRRHFGKIFGEAGLSGREEVVVYEDAMDSGYGRSCRGWFILKHLGHPNVRVLHGGYQAWLESGHPTTAATPEVQPRIFPVKPDSNIILTTEEMQRSLDDPHIIKLDVRDRIEWLGSSSSPYGPDFTPRKGRIPGAVWLEWYRLLDQEGNIPFFKRPEELRAIFTEAGINAASRVHIYCFKGSRTSCVFIALKMAGIDNIRNYFASWNEWSRDLALPIEEGYPRARRRK